MQEKTAHQANPHRFAREAVSVRADAILTKAWFLFLLTIRESELK
jgi:hypothetical protein